MLNKPLNMACPYCGQHKVEVITQIDPMSFNYHEKTKTICMFCGKVIEPAEKVTYSNSTDVDWTKITSSVKYCPQCNTKMEHFGDKWLVCPICHYGQMDYIGDPPHLSEEEADKTQKSFDSYFYIKDGDSELAVGKLDDSMSNTLQFDKCEKIIFRDKTLDFVFEIPDERYEDIDTIIVNGHKFVRDKSNVE